jgi:protein-disulfide isomerase
MVLCIIALPMFAILSIFSVKYRKLTKDAMHCLLKTVTLRKCESGLDEQIKAGITGSVFGYSPKLAGIINKNYKLLSWVFVIVMVASIYASGVGIYNYYLYGNCNGPSDTGFCPLDPLGTNSATSDLDVLVPEEIILPVLEDDDPIRGSEEAALTIIEFGCYTCPYTMQAEPMVEQLLDIYRGRVNLQFKNFIIPKHNESLPAAVAANCVYQNSPEIYESYHKAMFANQKLQSETFYLAKAVELGMDESVFLACYQNKTFREEIENDAKMGIKAGVIGTPTFFIGEQKVVGPKPFRTFKTVIEEELDKVEAKEEAKV